MRFNLKIILTPLPWKRRKTPHPQLFAGVLGSTENYPDTKSYLLPFIEATDSKTYGKKVLNWFQKKNLKNFWLFLRE